MLPLDGIKGPSPIAVFCARYLARHEECNGEQKDGVPTPPKTPGLARNRHWTKYYK